MSGQIQRQEVEGWFPGVEEAARNGPLLAGRCNILVGADEEVLEVDGVDG